MSQPLWKKLLELTEINNSISHISIDIEKISSEIAHLKKRPTTLEQEFEQKHLEVKKLQQTIKDIENLSNDVDEKLKAKKERVQNIKNIKEQQALEKEIAVAETESSDLEERLVSMWHTLELAQRDIEQKNKSLISLKDETEKQTNELAEKIATLKAQQTNLHVKKEEIEATVDSDWLERYNKMISKTANPIVPVHEPVCSACYYQILPGDLSRLKKNALLYCRNCYRLLYYPEKEAVSF